MRIVILGCGRLGSRLVNQLAKQGHQLVILDANEVKFKNIEDKQPVQRITGNVFNEEILAKAFSEKADVFIPVTGKDNVNIMIAQIVQKKFQVPRVIVRIFDPLLAEVYKGYGLETVCPTNFALDAMLNIVSKKSG
ncbi:MAG TPA: TrkA family potassium uptake protein [Nitrospiria bacterium]|jgi:trk system potassium uptake protein TrkA|nr:TrkA family potassium uptake protein [Nitrospiria bacterium]